MSFEIAVKALLRDAGRWDTTSSRLRAMAGDIGSLGIGAPAFSFLGGEAATAYEALRSLVHDYVGDGVGAADSGANALREVHRTYTGTDENAKQHIEEQWNWQ